MKLLCSIGVALSLLSTPVQAQSMQTGNEFLANCKEGTNAYSYCLGLVRGIYRGFTIAHNESKVTENFPDATSGQLLDVAIKYMTDNPNSRHISADVLIILAFVTAWPPTKTPD